MEKKDKYIPINKGHSTLDTNERIQNFEKNLSSGWEDEYKNYRRMWHELAKKREIRDYPLQVDLEMSSKCNLRCPMCYTTTDEFLEKVPSKYMDIELYKKIIDEIAGKVFAVRLSFRGEATLNKNFIEAIKYAKDKGIKEVSTLTHGKKMTGEYLEKVIDAGIDWITFSIDGMGQDYHEIRRPLTWEGTLSRLKEIKQIKEKKGLVKPVIKVQGIWPSIKKYPTEYYNTLKQHVDLVSYNPLIDYLDNDEDIEYFDNFSCPQLYQRIVIGSDGLAMMCSNDENGASPVGNAKLQTIHEIWHGDEFNRIRNEHNQTDGFKKNEVCKKCYYPRKTETSEKANVDGREITIENYTNRSQEIGK